MQKKAMNDLVIILFVSAFLLLISCRAKSIDTIEVFHKNKEPSLQTLEKTNAVLDKYKDGHEIFYYVITDSVNVDLIRKYNLPDTHFPFAIVINGRYSANINDSKIDFVHFPLFMHGIGRHEGNWSLGDLEAVLKDKSILLDNNVLSEEEHEEGSDESCPE
jgi:hypothetical protein